VGVRLVTPNEAEAMRLCGDSYSGQPDGFHVLTVRAQTLLRGWLAAGVSITLGARGALLVAGDGAPLVAPAPPPPGAGPVDACGAGDRYASWVAGALADGSLLSAAVVEAVVAASSFVFAGGVSCLAREPCTASTEGPRLADAVIAQCRARGGTVVATGGCFDLLHAGHVRMLEQARHLGDCLVVCLNSDASVRRLKGAGRPVVSQDDRAAVLLALGCVDAVVVFDEDTPEVVLDRLRPDVWAKGGDWQALPEAPLIESWGGQAVVLPYLAGRSTTTIIQEVTGNGA
jgi:rfaE bifunctional protein nucleotidyltransferase chain/domain